MDMQDLGPLETAALAAFCQAELIGDLPPGLAIDEAAAQDQDRRETLADVMVRHIGEQMRLANPGFARDKQSMLIR